MDIALDEDDAPLVHSTSELVNTASTASVMEVWVKGEGDCFAVDLPEGSNVNKLKKAIKAEIPITCKCDAPDLIVKSSEGGVPLRAGAKVVQNTEDSPYLFTQPLVTQSKSVCMYVLVNVCIC